MMRLLKKLASLRLTLAGFVVLFAAVIVDQQFGPPALYTIVPPLGLLACNLGAALLVDSRIRRTPALYAFHVCLLLLLLIAAAGQLLSFEARLSLVEGQAYQPDMLRDARGGIVAPPPLLAGRLQQASIKVKYAADLTRGKTHSRMIVPGQGEVEFGDDVPLVTDGYRIYTTSNKGFAVLLTWLPDTGGAQLGAVQFPSFPIKELGQQAAWTPPLGSPLILRLELPPSRYADSWTLDADFARTAALQVVVDGEIEHLEPGDATTLADGGRLTFEGIRMWMGYDVTYDPTLPWMFSVATLCVICMAVHFVGRLRRPASQRSRSPQRCPA